MMAATIGLDLLFGAIKNAASESAHSSHATSASAKRRRVGTEGEPVNARTRRERELVFHDLIKPISMESALAQYLQSVYHAPLTAVELADVQLSRFQWLWNFAPIKARCLYVRERTGLSPWSDLVAPMARVCSAHAEAGAVRAAGNMGLRVLDEYGYGVPFAMGSCNASRRALSRRATTLTPGSQAASSRFSADILADEVKGTLSHHSKPTPPAHEAIEVMRISSRAYKRGGGNKTRLVVEGGNNGCWFYAQRGTGIFLRAGRLLRVAGRRELLTHLNISREQASAEALRGPAPRILRGGMLDRIMHGERSGPYKPRFIEDFVPLCPHVRKAGYDTVILGNETKSSEHQPQEVVHCGDECVARVLAGACTPRLATGWRAHIPCACDDTWPILNCQPLLGTTNPAALPLHLPHKLSGLELATRGTPFQPGRLGTTVERCCGLRGCGAKADAGPHDSPPAPLRGPGPLGQYDLSTAQ